MLKVLVAIDQANLYHQMKDLGKKADFVSLRDMLANPLEGRYEVDTYIYAPLPQVNADGVIRWHDWLRSWGFVVVSKRAKLLPDGSAKCNLDGELILDVMEICTEVHPDVFVLVSGDGDFASLCHRLRRKGIRVEIAGLEANIASELRLAAHRIIDLAEWASCCEQI
jgi:uncharacterized LabA/DUF88 family protein